MMRALKAKPDVWRFVDGLEIKPFRQVVRKIFSLLKDPMPNDSILMEDGIYRVNIGEYRITYEFDDEAVRILVAGKRNDDAVYRQFRRLN